MNPSSPKLLEYCGPAPGPFHCLNSIFNPVALSPSSLFSKLNAVPTLPEPYPYLVATVFGLGVPATSPNSVAPLPQKLTGLTKVALSSVLPSIAKYPDDDVDPASFSLKNLL